MDNILGITPASIKISSEMLNLISELDEFKGEWKNIGILPDLLSSLKKVATIESIGSSTRIEGSKLTDEQIEQLLSQVDVNLQTRDEQEVGGYAFVCEKIFEFYDAIPLTENSIKQLHGWLLQYTSKDDRHRGEYKKIPITIEAFDSKGKSLGVVFETTSPVATPIKMQELIAWANLSFDSKILHPLIIIAIFIVIFLAIHPFLDGNGRLSRLLSTLLLLKNGYLYTPYSSLESIIENNKEAYYLNLQKTQKSWQNNKPDWNPWLMFFLQSLQRQKRHLEIKLQKELSLDSPILSQRIIDLLLSKGSLQINDIEKIVHCNRNTLKKTLSKLVNENKILKIGKGKGTWYKNLSH